MSQPAPSGNIANNLGALFNIGKALLPTAQNVYNLSQDPAALKAAGLTEPAQRQDLSPAATGGGMAPAQSNRISAIQALINNVNPQRQEALSFVDQGYNTNRQNIDVNKQAGFRNLNAAQDKLGVERDRGLRSLASNARNILQASQSQLGSMGAGDSSASDIMVPYALNQSTNQAKTDFMGGINDNQTQIDLRRQDIEDQAGIQMRDLDLWKSGQVNSIVNKFSDYVNNLRMMMAEAQDEQTYQSLSNAAIQAQEQAAAQLGQVENDYQVNAQGLSQGVNLNSVAPQAVGGLTFLNQGAPITGGGMTGFLRGRDDQAGLRAL